MFKCGLFAPKICNNCPRFVTIPKIFNKARGAQYFQAHHGSTVVTKQSQILVTRYDDAGPTIMRMGVPNISLHTLAAMVVLPVSERATPLFIKYTGFPASFSRAAENRSAARAYFRALNSSVPFCGVRGAQMSGTVLCQKCYVPCSAKNVMYHAVPKCWVPFGTRMMCTVRNCNECGSLVCHAPPCPMLHLRSSPPSPSSPSLPVPALIPKQRSGLGRRAKNVIACINGCGNGTWGGEGVGRTCTSSEWRDVNGILHPLMALRVTHLQALRHRGKPRVTL